MHVRHLAARMHSKGVILYTKAAGKKEVLKKEKFQLFPSS
jgi:hypothetical protein